MLKTLDTLTIVWQQALNEEYLLQCFLHWKVTWKGWFEVKNVLMMDLFITKMQIFASQDINWWTRVVCIIYRSLLCFYQLFGLSFWWHPFTEHPLVSKWCNTRFLQIRYDEKTNLSTSWMAWEWVNFHFGWTLRWPILQRQAPITFYIILY